MPQRISHRRGSHRQTGMAAVGFLNGINGQHTDGIDGGGGNPDDPAGAIVTPDTLARASSLNLNPADMLNNNNSTPFFRRLGDLLECGPTQTNVNDFRVLLVNP